MIAGMSVEGLPSGHVKSHSVKSTESAASLENSVASSKVSYLN